MFYRLIEQKRNEWLASTDCTITSLLTYIEQRGMMRDAQFEAIKTYLFLKIACDNLPLAELFIRGYFNTLSETDIDNLPLTSVARDAFKTIPAALALYEFASVKDEKGKPIAEELQKTVMTQPDAIDFVGIFTKLFYDVNYSDYVFSLPMGAGKTYLMAAFIYLDLYFAQQEPENPAFAHNFMVLVPSGLKTSVIPSLRTIQDFDPSWVIPEPAATNLKRLLKFEMLDENKSASKSNRTKNPNVQKIAIHEPLAELFGLVAVTNAEKVILDRVDKDTTNPNLFSQEELAQIASANELRDKIGRLPHLSLLIDEVHHVASSSDGEETKLRRVVNHWTTNGTITTVLGFSGTPYLDKLEKINVTDTQKIGTTEMSNITNYYALANGIGNFLKVPKVIKSDSNMRSEIVANGVRKFFELYKDTIYSNNTCAKLGIYCGTIETLETEIYPLVCQICSEVGLDPAEAVLKFHEGNKQYPQPQGARAEFAMLDKPFSKKRIVLLVQIGKEGWDCKSLTGIILSQENDCPKNMVLQTSCRCLREVNNAQQETALIYMNATNYKYLEEQLQKQQRMSIDEFQTGKQKAETVTLNRYDRTIHLGLPQMEFYQMQVTSTGVIAQPVTDNTTRAEINQATDTAKVQHPVTTEWYITNHGLEQKETIVDDSEHGSLIADFNHWLYSIAKESFGNISITQLQQYTNELRAIFNNITYTVNSGYTRFSSHYDLRQINANIRKAFYDKRTLQIHEEVIDTHASLLHINADTVFSPIDVQKTDEKRYYPEQTKVESIIKEDNGGGSIPPEIQNIITAMEAAGMKEAAENYRTQYRSDPNKDRTYHYLPYHMDSGFESRFLAEVITQQIVHDKDLEVYYNGDGQFTEFHINCFKKNAYDQWKYIGKYTPDFLIIKRQDGKIHKALIVETKGEIYAQDEAFLNRKTFVETEFLKQNNDKFGYRRFDYLYLEDTLSEAERINLTNDIIKQFFA